MQKQLTKEEREEFNKIRDSRLNSAEEEPVNLCLQYYLTYRAKADKTFPINIPLAFKWAFFMAEKSQYTINMKGQKVRGISFSLNKLLKDYKLEDAMFMLKEMIKMNTSIDNDTRAYLSNIVKQISFLMTFYSKFDRTFGQQFQLKQIVNDGGSYVRTFINYAWLLYVIVKKQILKGSCDVTPNTCMMAHIICSMLVLSLDYIRPEGLFKLIEQDQNFDQMDIKKNIKSKVLKIFIVKDITQYRKIATAFENYLNNMRENKMLKMNDEKWDFLSPENIDTNYKRLDKYFGQNQNIEDIDERIFLKERCLNLTPTKFTPFARQGYANKFQKPTLGNKLGGPKNTKQQTFNSHRILNYDVMEKQIETRNVPIQQIKLPKNIIQSPSMVKVPLIVTPISAGMGMYNYINEKKKRIKDINTKQKSFDKHAIQLINQVFDSDACENDNINKETKQEMIAHLFKIFSEEYLAANSYQVQTHELMKAILGLSIELVFFVSNISLTFEKIEEILHIDAFQMWKAIDFFLKSDKSIPSPIKIHFLDLQTQYLSYNIWQSMDMAKKLSDYGNKYLKSMSQGQINNMDKLLKRVLHQISLQITILTKQLGIDETIGEKIFDLLKEIIVNCPETLYKRHFDQLIICAIFAYSKALGLNIKFLEIKQKYVELYENLKNLAEQTLMSIYISENEEPKDIIGFYNKVFINNSKIKQFIVSTLDPNGTNVAAKNNAKKNTLLMSPMKAIIPKQFTFKAPKASYGNNAALKNKNGFTPQTQLLYAYSQSPILKYQVNTFKGPLKSKKVINYEQQQQKFRNNRSQQQDTVAPPTPVMKPTTSDNNIHPVSNYSTANAGNNYQSSTNDYITKKFGRKATTPTNQMQNPQQMYGNSQLNQLHLPLQNITKQNQNPPLSSNSHRALFEAALDKKQYNTQIDDSKYKNKNYQFGAYRRQ